MADAAVPVPIPVIIGVTGHRDIDLASPDILKVRTSVHDVLVALKGQFGSALYVMTALADGSDQLVADIAAALKIEIIAVLPMPLSIYQTRVLNKANLIRHWNKAALQIELPKTAVTGNTWSPGYFDSLYEQLGAFISRRSHILFALWEGVNDPNPRDTERHRGGTADVIRMRFDIQRANKAYHESHLFERSGSPLDASYANPVLHIVTPRYRGDSTDPRYCGSAPSSGLCFLLRDQIGMSADPVAPPAAILEVMSKSYHKDARIALDRIKTLNDCLLNEIQTEQRTYNDQYRYLEIDSAPDTDGCPLDWLRRAQAGVDAAAVRYQRRLHGHYVAWKLRHIPGHAAKSWLTGDRIVWPSALLAVAGSVPLAVMLFEWYAHLGHHWPPVPPEYCSLGLYLICLALVFGFHYFFVRRGDWQNRFQDYRALAEAIRVQLFWGLSALPIAASDNYLRKNVGELGWISFALRGPALWGASLALGMKEPCRSMVDQAWLTSQADYFIGKDRKSGKAAANERAMKRNRMWAQFSFVLGVAVAALLLLAEPSIQSVFNDCRGLLWFLGLVHHYEDPLKVVAATLPAIAAFLTVASYLRAYEAHAHNYKQMGILFTRSLDVACTIPASEHRAFKDLMRDLGREALSENAEWLMDHRDRPVEAGG